ncbi:MAG: hypothetical protein U9O97_03410, partial [Elusimicrobiota bacterium]|nr:hypothetical protein [Elusimicrobiota bacterium]
NNGHWTVEVWSNDYNKWIVMDPYYDCYYVDGSIPQGALELHGKIMEKKYGKLHIITGDKTHPVEKLAGRASYFTHLTVFMNNAFISFCDWTGATHIKLRPLCRKDEFTSGLKVFNKCPHTEIDSDFNWNLNQCVINIKKVDEANAKLKLNLETNTPFFSHFEIETNGKKTEFAKNENILLVWPLEPGINVMKIQAVNSFGIYGRESFIKVRYYPLAIWGIAPWNS